MGFLASGPLVCPPCYLKYSLLQDKTIPLPNSFLLNFRDSSLRPPPLVALILYRFLDSPLGSHNILHMQTSLSCTMNVSFCLDHPHRFQECWTTSYSLLFPQYAAQAQRFWRANMCWYLWHWPLYTDSSRGAQKELGFWHFQGGGPFGMNHMSRLGPTDCVQQTPSAFEACGDWEISVDHVA